LGTDDEEAGGSNTNAIDADASLIPAVFWHFIFTTSITRVFRMLVLLRRTLQLPSCMTGKKWLKNPIAVAWEFLCD
jgi:hypothetical protein